MHYNIHEDSKVNSLSSENECIFSSFGRQNTRILGSFCFEAKIYAEYNTNSNHVSNKAKYFIVAAK